MENFVCRQISHDFMKNVHQVPPGFALIPHALKLGFRVAERRSQRLKLVEDFVFQAAGLSGGLFLFCGYLYFAVRSGRIISVGFRIVFRNHTGNRSQHISFIEMDESDPLRDTSGYPYLGHR